MTRSLLWIGAAFLLVPHILLLAAISIYRQEAASWMGPVVLACCVTDFVGLVLVLWGVIRILRAYFRSKAN